jgi:hypothetical protein
MFLHYHHDDPEKCHLDHRDLPGEFGKCHLDHVEKSFLGRDYSMIERNHQVSEKKCDRSVRFEVQSECVEKLDEAAKIKAVGVKDLWFQK